MDQKLLLSLIHKIVVRIKNCNICKQPISAQIPATTFYHSVYSSYETKITASNLINMTKYLPCHILCRADYYKGSVFYIT